MERAAVVDAHHGALAVVRVRHPHVGRQRQRAVRGGEIEHVVDLAARRLAPVELRAVPGSQAAPVVAFGAVEHVVARAPDHVGPIAARALRQCTHHRVRQPRKAGRRRRRGVVLLGGRNGFRLRRRGRRGSWRRQRNGEDDRAAAEQRSQANQADGQPRCGLGHRDPRGVLRHPAAPQRRLPAPAIRLQDYERLAAAPRPADSCASSPSKRWRIAWLSCSTASAYMALRL